MVSWGELCTLTSYFHNHEQFHFLFIFTNISNFLFPQSGCYTLTGVNDLTMFDNLRLAMNVLNIAEDMVGGIFSVLSAVLMLGNMEFEDVEGEKSALTESDKKVLEDICGLLGMEMDSCTELMLFRQIQVRGTITSIPYKMQEVSRLYLNMGMGRIGSKWSKE